MVVARNGFVLVQILRVRVVFLVVPKYVCDVAKHAHAYWAFRYQCMSSFNVTRSPVFCRFFHDFLPLVVHSLVIADDEMSNRPLSQLKLSLCMDTFPALSTSAIF